MMLRNLVRTFLLLLFCLVLQSWGNTGHRNINYKSVSSLPASMAGFGIWADSLSANGSNADYRKSNDLNESPRHYIDIDNYPEFKANGKIASTYDSVVSIHNASFVIANGTLPWATVIAYDSLKNSLRKLQWHKAMLFASDLGHYVADGHMPLHLTSNYDGRATGQTGIHSRYESTLISNYLSSIVNYGGDYVNFVNNVNNYVLNYIYTNQYYVDSVLIADRYANNLVGNNYSTQYYSALWTKTKFTTTLFKNASHALAELIYSAWMEAGSPAFGSKVVSSSVENNQTFTAGVFPNPTNGYIYYDSEHIVKSELYSVTGNKLYMSSTNGCIDLTGLSNGIYVLILSAPNGLKTTEKVILQK